MYKPNYPVTLKSRLRVTEGHRKRNHWVDHTRLTISRVIWRWILSWPWNVGQRSLKVIENGTIWKLGYGFLFASIVTMAVFVAILEIFSVKQWPDLEIWVWLPSRSLKMLRFDRPCRPIHVLFKHWCLFTVAKQVQCWLLDLVGYLYFTAHGQRLLKLLMCSRVWEALHGIEAFNCRCTAMERLLSNSL